MEFTACQNKLMPESADIIHLICDAYR